MTSNRFWSRAVAGLAAFLLGAAAHAADVIVVNADAPGIGFNDPTPVDPVGGNPGTTLGEQRLNVFNFVAKFWGDRLESAVPISVLATFQPLTCNATSGVLGSAGPITLWSDFTGAKRPATWYPSALANKLAGEDLYPGPDPDGNDLDIIAFFNGNVGQSGCLDGLKFYLGLDGNAGSDINLLDTVLHEIGHGLGFATYTQGRTGKRFGPPEQPSVWDAYLYDSKIGKTWDVMTAAEIRQSAIDPRNLAWAGENVRRNAPRVLDRGTPDLFLFGAGLNKFYPIGAASFGPPVAREALAGSVAQVIDQPDGRGLACDPLDADVADRFNGNVALVDRGVCPFVVKVKNLQDAGAAAVIVADNVAGSPPPDLTGEDATITIPAVRVTLADGAEIKAAIASAAAPYLPVAVLFENQLKFAGADYADRVYLYTPNPFQQGSSVSHYDTSARPHLLMEPYINANQPIAASAPDDLTLELLKDIGW